MANEKLEIMLELERRGKLPSDKAPVLAELRRRGTVFSPVEHASQADIPPFKLPPWQQLASQQQKFSPTELKIARSGIVPFLAKIGDVASFGIAPRAGSAAGAFFGTLVDRLRGKREMESVVPGVGESFFEEMERRGLKWKEFKELMEKESPVFSAAGGVAGSLVPLSRIERIITSIPKLKVLVESGQLSKRIVGNLLRAPATSAIFSALDPDLRESLQSFAAGTGAGAGTEIGIRALIGTIKGIGKGAGKSGKLALELAPGGKAAVIRKFRDFFKGTVGETFPRELEEVAQKYGIDLGDIGASAEKSQKAIAAIENKAAENLEKIRGPILEKFGQSRVSPDRLRRGILKELDEFGLVDSAGNIVEESVETAGDAEAKSLMTFLRPQLEAIVKNPTLEELNNIRKSLQRASKFGQKGTLKSNIARRLRHAVVESIDEAVEGLAGTEQKGAFQSARKEMADVLNITDRGPVGTLLGILPEEAVRKAATTGKLDFPSVVDQAIETSEEFKEPMKALVLSDMLEKGSKSQANMKTALHRYRNVIGKLFDEKEVDDLRKLSGEKVSPFSISDKLNSMLNKITEANRASAVEMARMISEEGKLTKEQ